MSMPNKKSDENLRCNGVLLVTENTGLGGIPSYVILIAEGLRERGIPAEIAAVWPKPDNWLEMQCKQKGIALTVLSKRRSVLQMPLSVMRLAHRIIDRNYAIVHTQGYYSDLVGRAAYLLAGRRTRMVTTSHGIPEDPRFGLKVLYWLDRRTFCWSHATIANSQDTARRLNQLGVQTKNLKVVLHGVISQSEADRLRQTSIESNLEPIIGFVGRLSPEKGCQTLIEAANVLKERGVSFKVMIVGDGPDRPQLEARVIACGLQSQVEFVGWQADVAPYYCQANVIAVPSHVESLGLTILEAMLHGRAVVACRVRGIPEIITHERTGLLVESNDPNGLAQALQRCLTDGDLRSSLGDAARRYVFDNHTIEGMIDQTIAVYEGASGGNSSAHSGRKPYDEKTK